MVDQSTGEKHCPINSNLNAGNDGIGRLEAVNSPLSEFGVMGFEYGYSLQRVSVENWFFSRH